MKIPFFILLLYFPGCLVLSQPVFKNPGFPDHESYVLHEYLDAKVGYITSKINISLKVKNNMKYYSIVVDEGGLFRNEIDVRYSDLTTISEQRVDLKTNSVVQYFTKTGDSVRFFNEEKNVDKNIFTHETNIYSPLAYFLSFRGFPFNTGNSVSFKTYMYAYGGVLTMNLKQVTGKTVTVKAGTFDCNVLELSVGGWQSMFAPDKYYFYFSVDPPYRFIKYEEKVDGIWKGDELENIL